MQWLLLYLPFSRGVDRAMRVSAARATLLLASTPAPDDLVCAPHCAIWSFDSPVTAVGKEALALAKTKTMLATIIHDNRVFKHRTRGSITPLGGCTRRLRVLAFWHCICCWSFMAFWLVTRCWRIMAFWCNTQF